MEGKFIMAEKINESTRNEESPQREHGEESHDVKVSLDDLAEADILAGHVREFETVEEYKKYLTKSK